MNERRLACLVTVLKSPGLSVGEVAEEAGVPENQASINLRALQARGLLTARRDGRWIRYFPEPDPLVKHAVAVLNAVGRALRTGHGGAEAITETLRAFTHSRRLTILKCLTLRQGISGEGIVAATGISQPAVWRHLETLRRSGVVSVTKDGAWGLAAKKKLSALARALLEVIEKS
jgi:DNA-binding transcriptional ArsR family regulator